MGNVREGGKRRGGKRERGERGNIVLKGNEELLKHEAESGVERHNMAVWEGRKGKQVRL